MIVFIFFIKFLIQNPYIELSLVNSEVTMRSVNIDRDLPRFRVCHSYIKEIPYLPSLFLLMYVYMAKDKACAFRKRTWMKSFVF